MPGDAPDLEPGLEVVLAAAEELYAGPVAEFTARRTALAKAVAGEHGKAAGQQVTALRKPSTAAWALNLLVRRDADQIDQVLGLAASLRAAAEALDGEELRALTRQRRQLIAALATTARRRATQAGTRLSEPVVEQVETMLTAAMLDPVAAEVVRTGRVLTAFSATGVSELDPTGVVALPEALAHRAVPSPDPAPEPPGRPELALVADDGAALREAEESLEEAEGHERELGSARDAARSVVQDLDAQRLQLRGEADELRRRLADLEDRADEVDDEHEEAEAALEEAETALSEAAEETARARTTVERLR